MEYRKSRGSFVDHTRKSLTYTNIFIDSEEANAHQPKLSIKSYVESLRTEKDEWKEILRKKKVQCQDCEKQFKSEPVRITRRNVDEFLKQEDKDFLETKPNYLNVVELVKNYIDSINYLNKYKLDIIDYYRKAFNKFEIHKKILVEEMCANNLCDICNIKDCGWPDHEFDKDF